MTVMLHCRTKFNPRSRWLLTALLLIVPVTAAGNTLRSEDYQHELQRAITALESLREIDEDATPDYYQELFN